MFVSYRIICILPFILDNYVVVNSYPPQQQHVPPGPMPGPMSGPPMPNRGPPPGIIKKQNENFRQR